VVAFLRALFSKTGLLIAMLMTGAVAFANGGPKDAKKSDKKAQTEKTCPKGCCDKDKCVKGDQCDKCDKS